MPIPKKLKEMLPEETGNSVSHEGLIANSLGGKVQPGSGSSQYAKGDVKSPFSGESILLTECKTTAKKSIRIQNLFLEKISKEAFAEQGVPGFSFQVNTSDSMCERTWVAVPLSVYKRMALVE